MFICMFVQEGLLMCVCETEGYGRMRGGETWGYKGAEGHRDTVDKI